VRDANILIIRFQAPEFCFRLGTIRVCFHLGGIHCRSRWSAAVQFRTPIYTRVVGIHEGIDPNVAFKSFRMNRDGCLEGQPKKSMGFFDGELVG